MKIKITRENREEIEAALKAVNGKSTSFTITTLEEVGAAAVSADEHLNNIFLDTQKAAKGARFMFIPAGPSAKSYKYPVNSTRITIEKGAKDWFLVDVGATSIYPKNPSRTALILSPVQKRAAVLRFEKALEAYAPGHSNVQNTAHTEMEIEAAAQALA